MKPRRTVKIPLKRTAAPTRQRVTKQRARAAASTAEIEEYEGESEPSMRFSHALFVVLILHVVAVAGVFAFNSIEAGRSNASKKAAAKVEGALPTHEGRDTETKPIVKAPLDTPATKAPAADAKPSATTKVKPVAANSQAATKDAGARHHTIVAGDTLTKVAATYKTNVEALAKANHINALSVLRIGQELVIPESKAVAAPTPTALKPLPGKALIASVPKGAKDGGHPAAESSPAAPAPGTTAKRPPEGVYEVVSGDNPYAIAKRFNVSYKELLQINHIEDPKKIQIGQKLKLP